MNMLLHDQLRMRFFVQPLTFIGNLTDARPAVFIHGHKVFDAIEICGLVLALGSCSLIARIECWVGG